MLNKRGKGNACKPSKYDFEEKQHDKDIQAQ
jgi:hypothetical protein